MTLKYFRRSPWPNGRKVQQQQKVLRKVSVTQQKYTGFSSKSEEWSPSQSPFRYSIWQLGSFFERHMRSLSSFDFIFHQDVVIIWGKQPWYYIFIDSLFISRALFYDILKSALQAFWKCGSDGANKFIHRHNYAGEIAMINITILKMFKWKFLPKWP